MHLMDWAQALQEGPKLESTLEWCHNNWKKGTTWAQQLENLNVYLGSLKNQPKGKYIIRNANKLALLGDLLYYKHCPEYLKEIKWFVVLRAH